MISACVRETVRATVRDLLPLRRGTALVVAIGLLVAGAAPAQAEDAATARAKATAAARRVHELTARLATADASYAQATSQVGQQVSDFIVADGERADAERAAQLAADRSAASARALYQSGGQAGLLNTVLASGDVADFSARLSAVDLVLAAARQTADDATQQAAAAAQVADGQAAGADASVVTAGQLADQAAAVQSLLDEAQAALDGLSARARSLTEAEAAAKALAEARAAAEALRLQAVGAVRAQVPPATYFALYHAAAATCPGMDWTLLAAVGQVESGHGRNTATSSAGAVGPMQFMPATFAAYAVDGDHDGRLDPWSPADAIFTAARYLCAGGAGSPAGVRAALFRYNRAQWYVDLVLAVQAQIRLAQG